MWLLAGWVCCLLVLLAVPARAEYREQEVVAPGVTQVHIVRTAGPVEIEALIVDLAQARAKPEVSLGRDTVVGLRRLSDQALDLVAAKSLPLAGVNGDFFFLEPLPSRGDPLGLCIRNGELISAPSEKHRSALAILEDGQPFVGVPQWQASAQNERGQGWALTGLNEARPPDGLVLFTPTFGPSTATSSSGTEVRLTGAKLPLSPHDPVQAVVETVYDGLGDTRIEPNTVVLSAHGQARPFLQGLSPGELVTISIELSEPFKRAVEAIGGGPRLVREGSPSVEWREEGFSASFANDLHPRTAAGFGEGRLILVTVDGRQPGYSVGVSLYDLAETLRGLGATEALNLDGGGSTTFWGAGQVLNAPSGDVERPVADALFLVNAWPPGEPARLRLSASPSAVLVGGELPLRLEAWDALGNRLEALAPQWSVTPPEAGTVSASGVFRAQKAGTATIAAHAGSAGASLEVRVVESLAGARLRPSGALLFPGESVQFLFEGLDERSQPVAVPLDAIAWTVEGMGDVDSRGEFSAPGEGNAALTAQAAGKSAKAWIACGGTARTLEDFEETTGWGGAAYPKWTPAYFRVSSRESRRGLRAGQLRYDFSAASATVAAYATWGKEIGSPLAIGAWVYGDGGGHLLRCRLMAKDGKDAAFDMSPRMDWEGEWRFVGFRVPPDLVGPLKLMSVYVAETDPQKRGRGLIYIDEVRALYSTP